MARTAGPLTGSVEMPSWKTLLNHAAALVVAFLFIAAGVYKAIDPYKFANLAHNLLVWKDWTLPLALGLAVAETTAGAATFCRSSGEIAEAIEKVFSTIGAHYSVTLALPERSGKNVEVGLDAEGGSRTLSYRTHFFLQGR